MKILAFMGSYRTGKTIDSLVDKAIEGAKSAGEVQIEKIVLKEKNIGYCKNCMVCRNDDPEKPRSYCIIHDDMDEIYSKIEEADGFIFGTPVNMGGATALMKAFLERVCWVFAKPGKRPVAGCPEPRRKSGKKAIIIVSSGLIKPFLRRFCDDATPMIKDFCSYSLGARTVGTLYAGGVEKVSLKPYAEKAVKLGKKLVLHRGK